MPSSSSAAAITVSFKPDPVKTGYSLPVKDSTIKRTVAASVDPKEETDNVAISIKDDAGKDRIAIENVTKNAEMGVITFDVFGKDATPSDKPEGDTTIQAKKGGEVLASVKVVVVIPKIHERSLSSLKYENTSTPRRTVPGTNIKTSATRIATITVKDQFGGVLDTVYDGKKVVQEIFTKPTDHWKEGFERDEGKPLTIVEPDDKFESGIKKDAIGIVLAAKTDVEVKERDWSRTLALVKIPGKDPMGFNTAFAVRIDQGTDADNNTSTILQRIQVHGHDTKFKTGGVEYDNAKRVITQKMRLYWGILKPDAPPNPPPLEIDDVAP